MKIVRSGPVRWVQKYNVQGFFVWPLKEQIVTIIWGGFQGTYVLGMDFLFNWLLMSWYWGTMDLILRHNGCNKLHLILQLIATRLRRAQAVNLREWFYLDIIAVSTFVGILVDFDNLRQAGLSHFISIRSKMSEKHPLPFYVGTYEVRLTAVHNRYEYEINKWIIT